MIYLGPEKTQHRLQNTCIMKMPEGEARDWVDRHPIITKIEPIFCTLNARIVREYHPAMVILIMGGTGSLVCEGKSYPLLKGVWAIIDAHIPFTITSDDLALVLKHHTKQY